MRFNLKYVISGLALSVFFVMPAHASTFHATTTSASRSAHSSHIPQSTEKKVALTFDDGPYGTSTEEVLGILKQQNVHATFFLIGQNVEKYPALTREIVADGNVIGNHTYTHPNLAKLTTAAALQEVNQTEAMIASTTGVTPQLFRPPYGLLPKATKKALKKEGYRIDLWNDDPEDWNASSTSAQIVTRVLSQEGSYTVVILHDGRDTHINYPRDNMVDALPTLISDFRSQGYTFITL